MKKYQRVCGLVVLGVFFAGTNLLAHHHGGSHPDLWATLGIINTVANLVQTATPYVQPRPVVVQPVVVQPTVAQPVVVQPTVAQPVVVQPTVAQPVVVQPTVAQPVVVTPTTYYYYPPAPVYRPAPIRPPQHHPSPAPAPRPQQPHHGGGQQPHHSGGQQPQPPRR